MNFEHMQTEDGLDLFRMTDLTMNITKVSSILARVFSPSSEN